MTSSMSGSRRLYDLSTLAIVCLVGLRMSVGWYFFNGAREKNLNQDFTSATFLAGAEGFLADWYQAPLPDYHGWRRLMEQPLEDTPNPYDAATEPDDWEAFHQRAYGDWYRLILDDWGRHKEKVAGHYAFDPAQEERAKQVLVYYDGRLRAHLADTAGEIAAYRHELYRLEQMAASRSARGTPFEQERMATKQAEAAGQARQIQAGVEEIEREYRRELAGLATDDQRQRGGGVPVEASALATFDTFLKYSHFAIGGCLLVGLLTRLAAFGAGTFLLMVVLSRPPWDVGYQMVGYQIVMMFACFLLMATPAGRWAGLDYFLPAWLPRCCAPATPGDA